MAMISPKPISGFDQVRNLRCVAPLRSVSESVSQYRPLDLRNGQLTPFGGCAATVDVRKPKRLARNLTFDSAELK